MNLRTRGMLVVLFQLAIVFSLAAKLFYDRSVRPRVWARTVAYDPDSVFRGRYISMRLEVDARAVYPNGIPEPNGSRLDWGHTSTVALTATGSKLTAIPTDAEASNRVLPMKTPNGTIAVLDKQIDFYIPETAPDPTRRVQGEELWVEVTIPRKGPPRPIRLGVMKDGKLTPLSAP